MFNGLHAAQQMFQSLRRPDGSPAYGPEPSYNSPPQRDFYGIPAHNPLSPFTPQLNPAMGMSMTPNFPFYPSPSVTGGRHYDSSPSPPTSSVISPVLSAHSTPTGSHEPFTPSSISPSVSYRAVATIVPPQGKTPPVSARENTSFFRPF